jgi:hypothetical protein
MCHTTTQILDHNAENQLWHIATGTEISLMEGKMLALSFCTLTMLIGLCLVTRVALCCF